MTGEPTGHDNNPSEVFTEDQLSRLRFLKREYRRIHQEESSAKDIRTPAVDKASQILQEARDPKERVLEIKQDLLTSLFNNKDRKPHWPYHKDGLTVDSSTIVVSHTVRKDNFQIDLDAKTHREKNDSDDMQRSITIRYNDFESGFPSQRDATQVAYLIEIEPDGNFLVQGHTVVNKEEINSSYYYSREPNYATIGVLDAVGIIDHISQAYLKVTAQK